MDERDGMCLVAIVVQVVRCKSWLEGDDDVVCSRGELMRG